MIWPVKYIETFDGLGCCQFWGSGSVVVNSLFIVACGLFCVWSLFCNAVLCVISRFAIILLRKREPYAGLWSVTYDDI